MRDAQIPASFYNVNEFNNVLVVDGISYSIPIQNYSISQLITQIQTLISGLTVTLNRQTNLLTFSKGSTFTLGGSAQTCDTLIGNIPGYVSTGSNTYTLDHSCNLGGPLKLSIYTNLIMQNYDSLYGNVGLIASIPVSCMPGEFIYYTEPYGHDMLFSNPSLTELTFDIRDELGNYIDFMGLDSYYTVQIDEIIDIDTAKTFTD